MNRNLILAVVIAIELAVGGVLVVRREPLLPPVPNLDDTDPAVAAHIRERAENCRSPADWAALGEVYLAYGYFPEGEACYRVAAEREPENATRQYEWGFALERIGRLEEANAAYQLAAKLGHPDPGGCWYSVGRNHLRREDVNAARTAFGQADGHPSARYELARLLVRDGQHAEAIPILDQLTAEYPTALQPLLLRHKIESLTDGPATTAFADRALRATGRLPTPFDRDWKRLEAAHDRLGRAAELIECDQLLAAGQGTAAGPRLQSLLNTDWDPKTADRLAEVEFLRGRPADAARLLQEAIDRAGPSAHLLERLGDAHAEVGQKQLAVAAWLRATHLGTIADVKHAHHKLATHHEKAGDKDAAMRHFALAYFGAAQTELAAGRLTDARDLLDEALQHDPRLAAAWFHLGELHRARGETESARKAYRQCLAIDPDFGRAITGLGLLK